jgi:ABC-type dipeptide/oligopeptide/nickel transport system permease component
LVLLFLFAVVALLASLSADLLARRIDPRLDRTGL